MRYSIARAVIPLLFFILPVAAPAAPASTGLTYGQVTNGLSAFFNFREKHNRDEGQPFYYGARKRDHMLISIVGEKAAVTHATLLFFRDPANTRASRARVTNITALFLRNISGHWSHVLQWAKQAIDDAKQQGTPSTIDLGRRQVAIKDIGDVGAISIDVSPSSAAAHLTPKQYTKYAHRAKRLGLMFNWPYTPRALTQIESANAVGIAGQYEFLTCDGTITHKGHACAPDYTHEMFYYANHDMTVRYKTTMVAGHSYISVVKLQPGRHPIHH